MQLLKPIKKLNIGKTVYPDERPVSFNDWINYIHREAKKKRIERVNNFFNNKISKQ